MDPFLGEIRLFAGSYIPENWVACNGQTLSVTEYQALYSLLGTTYGGDGVTTFAVPNLQVALAVGQSGSVTPPTMANPYPLAQKGGAYQVTLTEANLPNHTHAASVSSASATTVTPGPSVTFAATTDSYTAYVTSASPPTVTAAANAVSSVGGGQGHQNMMPTLVMNYIMAVAGIYPDFPD